MKLKIIKNLIGKIYEKTNSFTYGSLHIGKNVDYDIVFKEII